MVKRAETELGDPTKREGLLDDYYRSHKNEIQRQVDSEIKRTPGAGRWSDKQYMDWVYKQIALSFKRFVKSEKERIERVEQSARLREKQALELEQQKREQEAAARRQRQERERERAEDYRRQQEQKRRRERELREAPRRAVKITKRHFKRVGLEKIPSKEERLLEAWRIDWSELEHLFEDKKKLEQMCKQAVKVAIVQLDREEKARLKELQLAGREEPEYEPVTVTKNWLGLREIIYARCVQKELSHRDSVIVANYVVPNVSRETRVELRRRLLEGELKDLNIRPSSFNDIVRRRVSQKGSTITGTDLGACAERFTHRLLQGSIECHVGPRPSGVCDISDREDGNPASAAWAVNTKLSTEDECDRVFEISPEYQVAKSWVLLIMPRILSMFIFAINGREQMVLNNNTATLCVSVEGLADRLKEMIG